MDERLRNKLSSHRTIDTNTGCWLWTAGIKDNGYGNIWYNGTTKHVHKLAYQEFVGPVTKLVLHKCPNRHCFNPDHLYEGDYSDNHRDAREQGKYGNIMHCPKGHEYTPENIYIQRGYKTCRQCRKIASHNHWVETRGKNK